MRGEGEASGFTRCAAVDPPAERSLRLGSLELELRERALSVRAPGELRVAAFSGPVGAAFSRADIAQLTAARPSVLLYLGGLGDTHEVASANLSALAALHVPTLFVPGGADRLPVVQSAFEELAEDAAEYVIDGSGLRELRVGSERFAVLPGAAFGRYALDDESCGFDQRDLDALESAFEDTKDKGRRWLLAWNAPSGWSVTRGYGNTELGSDELGALARELGVRGGLFAYPEAQSLVRSTAESGGLVLVVPRLGRTGTTRADGSRLPAALATITAGPQGLRAGP